MLQKHHLKCQPQTSSQSWIIDGNTLRSMTLLSDSIISCNFKFHHLLVVVIFFPCHKANPQIKYCLFAGFANRNHLVTIPSLLALPSHASHRLDLLWRSHMHAAKVSESPLPISIKTFARIDKKESDLAYNSRYPKVSLATPKYNVAAHCWFLCT